MKITEQEAFDRMVNHLRKQGKKSVHEITRTCLYRHPDGLKCAVGALIPDELYKPDFETRTASDVFKLSTHLNSLFVHDIYLLLDRMQEIHDFAEPHHWEERFKEVAEEYYLRYTENTV